MSLIGIKDLDYLLADRLDDRSIFNLQQTNQYYYKLFDDKYYLKRYLKKYGDLLSNKLDLKKIKITKELYFENQKYLICSKHVAGTVFAISQDRPDLLFLIVYFLKTEIRYLVNSYNILQNIVEKDAIECFKYHYCGEFEYFIIEIAIKNKSDRILRYLDRFDLFNDSLMVDFMIYLSIIHYSPCYLELLLNKRVLSDKLIDDVLIRIIHLEDMRKTCYNWSERYNRAAYLFISNLSEEKVEEIKSVCLEENRYYIIKLLTVYRSGFSDFAKDIL